MPRVRDNAGRAGVMRQACSPEICRLITAQDPNGELLRPFRRQTMRTAPATDMEQYPDFA